MKTIIFFVKATFLVKEAIKREEVFQRNIQIMFKTRRIREKLSQEKEEHGSTKKKKDDERKWKTQDSKGKPVWSPSHNAHFWKYVRTRHKPRMRAGAVEEPGQKGEDPHTLDKNCENSFLSWLLFHFWCFYLQNFCNVHLLFSIFIVFGLFLETGKPDWDESFFIDFLSFSHKFW